FFCCMFFLGKVKPQYELEFQHCLFHIPNLINALIPGSDTRAISGSGIRCGWGRNMLTRGAVSQSRFRWLIDMLTRGAVICSPEAQCFAGSSISGYCDSGW